MSLYPESTVVANTAYLKTYSFVESVLFGEAYDRQPIELKHSRVQSLMAKSAVGPITGPELLPASDTIAFLKTQRNQSFFARAISDGAFWPISFDVQPVANTAYVQGATLSDFSLIPVKKFDFNAPTLRRRRIGSMTVIGRELVRIGGAKAVNTIQSLLGASCSSAIDRQIIDDIQSNAGTYRILSSGSTAESLLADARLMLGHVNVENAGALYWVASRDTANILSTIDSTIFQNMGAQGGELLGSPLIVSDGLESDSAGSSLMLVDASSIAANVEDMRIDASEQATIQMNDMPDEQENAVSMYQTNSVAIRANLTFGFELMGGFRAAYLGGIV